MDSSFNTLPVGRRHEAKVDPEDYEEMAQYLWFAIPSGGRKRPASPVATRHEKVRGGKRTITMHRQILRMADDDRRVVHHINGNNLDNRKANLQIHEAKVKIDPVVSELERPEGPCIRVGGNRPRRHGRPSVIRWARVDAEDVEHLSRFNWSASGRRTRPIAIRRQRHEDGSYQLVQMHREIMGIGHGDPRVVDHRNGDSLDNRKENLRVVTVAQNAENRPNGIHLRRNAAGVKGRTSKYRGVVYEPKYRLPWATVLRFPTEEEAAAARQAWERQHMPYADPSYEG